MVTMNMERQALMDKAKNYLRNPVQKRLYVKAEDWILALPKAGMEAKLVKTELGERKDSLGHAIRAIEKREYLKCADTMKNIDPAWDTEEPYIELEVWRYDPARFTGNHAVDSISLSLSFLGEDDNALELNINEL